MTTSPLKILAVDDTPQNLLALQALLADPSLQLLTADSGPAALELLLQHDVALALLDVQMPDMDGYALAELMRGAERTRHVPIIFLTASGQEDQRSFRGYEAGAVDFLYKPLDGMVLRSKVKVFSDLHRQRLLLAERLADQERLQRVHATMLSALSHDIRTPMTALSLNAELLIRRGDDVGRRIKTATSMLARQVDHLVNLARRPVETAVPELQSQHLGPLVQARLNLPANQALVHHPFEYSAEGDDTAWFDPHQLAEALDHLLLQAATHAGDHPVRLHLDGLGRHAVVLRLSFDGVLSASAATHLLGDGLPHADLETARSGPGLMLPERVARAHGGSLIGRSKEREGTLFELMLPRGPLA
jgi:two-component system, sensor histidine kinase and response regulator